ncbi:GNAT family N-acetyltransferase [Streptomyces sp. cmx-4-7]|uniref:GNAT family N-acetyltransferase n=1 Tax=Streptomyces sp. cmx-4-7 TaxID=2790939 RepID=UPI0039802094
MPIREALPGDAAALAAVHVLSWRAAYRELLPGPYLEGLDVEERAATWHARLTAPDRPTVLLATDGERGVGSGEGAAGDGERGVGGGERGVGGGEEAAGDGKRRVGGGRPVAFACFRPWPGEGFDPAPTAELAALYALPEVWGTGIGRALLSVTTGALVTAGFRSAALWVFAGNGRARRFYEAAGWRADGGAAREETGGWILEELRYRRDLSR